MASFDLPPDIELMLACSNWLLSDTPANANRVERARPAAAGFADLESVRMALVLCDQAGADRAARERARRRLSEALTRVAAARRAANGIRRREPVRPPPPPPPPPPPAEMMPVDEDAEPWWRR